MKKAVIMLASLLLLSQPVMADDLTDVDGYLKNNLESIMKLLRDKQPDKKARNEKIVKVIIDAWDFPKMAKLTLGRKHWPGLTKEEKTRFNSLFIERLKASYLEKLDLYTDEDIQYKTPVRVKKKIHVLTELVSGDNKISIRYKFYKSKKKGWQVYDLEIEGVSLITTYRSQFGEVLRTGTIDDLFKKLERPDGK